MTERKVAPGASRVAPPVHGCTQAARRRGFCAGVPWSMSGRNGGVSPWDSSSTGIWEDSWYDTANRRAVRALDAQAFRNWVTPDGSAGPSGEGGFAAESGRYHLYVSYACPWAHRTLIFRALKGLEEHIDVSVVHPDMLSDGWTFDEDFDGATGDRLYRRRLPARDLPARRRRDVRPGDGADPVGQGAGHHRVERKLRDHPDVQRGLRRADRQHATTTGREPLRDEIEAVNERVYETVNNGVYRAGFATTQERLRRGGGRAVRRASTGSRTGSRGSATWSATG